MEKKNNLSGVLLGVFLVTTLLLGGFVVYDKLLKKEEVVECPKYEEKECPQTETTECPKCENETCNCANSSTSCLGEKVTSLKEINLTTTNQEIKIGKRTYKIRKNSSDVLMVNDKETYDVLGDEFSPYKVYLTDKFLFATNAGQFDESIQYALGENDELGGINNNDSQMRDFKIVNGYLHAHGGEIYPGEYDLGIKEGDLIIKFIDNTLIVVPYK